MQKLVQALALVQCVMNVTGHRPILGRWAHIIIIVTSTRRSLDPGSRSKWPFFSAHNQHAPVPLHRRQRADHGGCCTTG